MIKALSWLQRLPSCLTFFRVSCLNVCSVETWWKGPTLEYIQRAVYIRPGVVRAPIIQASGGTDLVLWAPVALGVELTTLNELSVELGHRHDSHTTQLLMNCHLVQTPQSWGDTPSRLGKILTDWMHTFKQLTWNSLDMKPKTRLVTKFHISFTSYTNSISRKERSASIHCISGYKWVICSGCRKSVGFPQLWAVYRSLLNLRRVPELHPHLARCPTDKSFSAISVSSLC